MSDVDEASPVKSVKNKTNKKKKKIQIHRHETGDWLKGVCIKSSSAKIRENVKKGKI